MVKTSAFFVMRLGCEARETPPYKKMVLFYLAGVFVITIS